jgi:hypothetical protein
MGDVVGPEGFAWPYASHPVGIAGDAPSIHVHYPRAARPGHLPGKRNGTSAGMS